MGRIELPHPKDVRDLLHDLMGRDVDVNVIDAWVPTPRDCAALGEFVDDGMRLRAVMVVDLPLAVYCGAAVGLLPAGGAHDMIDERDHSPTVLENLYEVLNVMSALLNFGDNDHVKIAGMYPPGAEFPQDSVQLVQGLIARLDLGVSIDGYGAGRMGLIAAR